MTTSTNTPRVSVVMCVYNGEKYLREAMESILTQSFTDFEFIIVNDGSTDRSEQIALSYDDKRIHYHTYEKSRGLPAALNVGIALAQGEYLARMDADDVSTSDRLLTQVAFLDQHPTVGVVGSWAQVFGGERDHVWKNPTTPEEVGALLLFNCCLLHPTVMIRRSILTEHNLRYNEQFTTAQDYELWSRVREVTELTNIPRILLRYRTHGEGNSILKKAEREQNTWLVQVAILNKLGIVPTETERVLHQSSVPANTKYPNDYIHKKEAWLLTLLETNQKVRLFNLTALKSVVLKIWLATHDHLGVTTLERLRAILSQLFIWNLPSLLRFARLCIKTRQ